MCFPSRQTSLCAIGRELEALDLARPDRDAALLELLERLRRNILCADRLPQEGVRFVARMRHYRPGLNDELFREHVDIWCMLVVTFERER